MRLTPGCALLSGVFLGPLDLWSFAVGVGSSLSISFAPPPLWMLAGLLRGLS